MRFRLSLPAMFCALATFAQCAFGQTDFFPKPSYFRETFATPTTRVDLRPPVKLADFVVEGKDGKVLELSLRSYLELVMANNTDIAVQRLTVEFPKDAILRAFAPFDPLAIARWTSTRSKTPATDQLQGAATLVTLAQPANFQYNQLLTNGTSYNVAFFGQKNSTNSTFSNFNPALNSTLAFNVTQPLLKNRGSFVNRLPIMAARSRLRVSEYNLKSNLITLVANAENAYWDVVLARDNLRVQEEALKLAQEALKRAQQELDLGAMSPLDIYNPQQNQATAEISVSQARFQLKQREDALRKEIGVDLNPDLRNLPVVLTESVEPPVTKTDFDVDATVQRALLHRPDLKAANQLLDVDDLSIKSATNNLRPDLSLIGGYTSQGRGGIFHPRDSTGQFLAPVPGGFVDAVDQVFGFGFPIYSFGVQLRLPIKNRQAAADLADALVSKKSDSLVARGVEQTVRLDVLNAINQVQSAQESVKLAKVALDFSHKYLDAEQKKYELGTSTIYFVLQAQQALVNAEAAVVQNSISYRRNLLNILQRTGELLEERGIAVQ